MTKARDLSQVPNASLGFKNRLINGDCRIDQRNAGASVLITGSAPYSLDRWQGYSSTGSKFTVQRNAGSVTPPVGFTNYAGCTSNSAYSITSTDQMIFQQSIEGFNCADLAWGTANAATVTLSFWVRSSLTGTFGGSLQNAAQNRCYPFSFTISAANTWEQKSITIAGDTTGTWLTNNEVGIRLIFSLGTGSTYSATAGSWTGTSYISSATGATSVVGTSGATFYITGVQLEKGSTATSFDYRPYGTELALCQRYCYKQTNSTSGEVGVGFKQGSEYIKWTVTIPVTMRTAPTWVNPPTSYVTTNLTASGQVTSYNFAAAALYTISGSLSTLNQLNVNGGGLYIVASSSFSGSAGNASGIAMFDAPIYSAEL
jgi:hypothetical protein